MTWLVRLRIERDRHFWRRVVSHPAVEPYVMKGSPLECLDALVADPLTLPIASKHGGFLFVAREGQARELHTAYLPEGWGREVAAALPLATQVMFNLGVQRLTTLEQKGYGGSRPPLSHGWKPAGEFAESAIGSVREWELTAAAWRASPVWRRRNAPSRSPAGHRKPG